MHFYLMAIEKYLHLILLHNFQSFLTDFKILFYLSESPWLTTNHRTAHFIRKRKIQNSEAFRILQRLKKEMNGPEKTQKRKIGILPYPDLCLPARPDDRYMNISGILSTFRTAFKMEEFPGMQLTSTTKLLLPILIIRMMMGMMWWCRNEMMRLPNNLSSSSCHKRKGQPSPVQLKTWAVS